MIYLPPNEPVYMHGRESRLQTALKKGQNQETMTSTRPPPAVSTWATGKEYAQSHVRARDADMNWAERNTFDPAVMGGKPCIRGMRVTIVGLIAAGRPENEILGAYPYLELADLRAALAYAAWRSEERELPLATGDATPTGHESVPGSVSAIDGGGPCGSALVNGRKAFRGR